MGPAALATFSAMRCNPDRKFWIQGGQSLQAQCQCHTNWQVLQCSYKSLSFAHGIQCPSAGMTYSQETDKMQTLPWYTVEYLKRVFAAVLITSRCYSTLPAMTCSGWNSYLKFWVNEVAKVSVHNAVRQCELEYWCSSRGRHFLQGKATFSSDTREYDM